MLYVPRVLDPEQCRSLIELYHSGGNAPTGHQAPNQCAARRRFGDSVRERCAATILITDPARAQALGAIIGKRVVTEIFKAFSFRVKYVKEFKIGCYDAADQGFFLPHRDNYAEQRRAGALP